MLLSHAITGRRCRGSSLVLGKLLLERLVFVLERYVALEHRSVRRRKLSGGVGELLFEFGDAG